MTQTENEKQQRLGLKFSRLPKAGLVLFVTVKGREYRIAFCHRIEEHCIKIGKYTSLLCARCTGIVIGAGLAVVLLLLNVTLPLYALGLICLPLLIDGFTQFFGLRKSNNPLRFVSGVLFAIGIMLFLLQR